MPNYQFKLSALTLAMTVVLSGCGGSNDNQTSGTTPPPVQQALSAQDVTVTDAKQWLPSALTLKANKDIGNAQIQFFEGDTEVLADNGVYTFSHGVVLKTDNEYSYTSLNGESATIGYALKLGTESAKAKILIKEVGSDPLVNEQWHLRNTAQSGFLFDATFTDALVELAGEETANQALAMWQEKLVAGEDINVLPAYLSGALGQDTISVVVDTGADIDHPDLINNVLPGRSLDLARWSADRTNPNDNGEGHGTAVAGIIAAEGWNGIGGHGVAPKSQLIAMRYLQPSERWDTYEGTSFEFVRNAELAAHGYPNSGISVDEPVVAFNRSYGYGELKRFQTQSNFYEQLERYPTDELRQGKGALNIKAAGNDFDWCGIHPNLTCTNANFARSQSHLFYQTVAAINTDGKQSSYSSNGANVLWSAPAGEASYNAPGTVTTDIVGCLDGMSAYQGAKLVGSNGAFGNFGISALAYMPLSTANGFNYSAAHAQNSNCNYTNTMNGTSAAAPMVSGVVALVVSANPELNWRDVKDIMIRSTTQNDPQDPIVNVENADGKVFQAHAGWITNAAGLKFNNRYGFGRVNAGKAVALAKAHEEALPALEVSEWLDVSPQALLTIPNNDVDGVTISFNVPDDLVVEAVRLKVDIQNSDKQTFNHATERFDLNSTAGVDLAMEIISPAATRSQLLTSKQALTETATANYLLKDAAMMSNAFYGESAQGQWQVRFADVGGDSVNVQLGSQRVTLNDNLVSSQVEKVRFQIYGHKKPQ
ncbi:S8 family serine peptidase [Pseudoalteromonas fenneropenaei]|uniref:S8 family serine peptidase n=1 Tax=Pseudoalteromonas fenneropenaei TaxID=1737459 RepID=A0ABV7CK83_9GAMM